MKIECNDVCQYCGFDIPSLGVHECQTFRRTSRVLLSQAPVDIPEVFIEQVILLFRRTSRVLLSQTPVDIPEVVIEQVILLFRIDIIYLDNEIGKCFS